MSNAKAQMSNQAPEDLEDFQTGQAQNPNYQKAKNLTFSPYFWIALTVSMQSGGNNSFVHSIFLEEERDE